MPRCYRCCKYYNIGVCSKYNERILISKNPAHYGILLHPLEYLKIYYDENKDLDVLIKKAEEYLSDSISKNICNYYKEKGHITFKQRKLLLRQFFDCYTDYNKK